MSRLSSLPSELRLPFASCRRLLDSVSSGGLPEQYPNENPSGLPFGSPLESDSYNMSHGVHTYTHNMSLRRRRDTWYTHQAMIETIPRMVSVFWNYHPHGPGVSCLSLGACMPDVTSLHRLSMCACVYTYIHIYMPMCVYICGIHIYI